MRLKIKNGELIRRGGELLVFTTDLDFVMLVQTDNDGTSEDNEFTIPTTSGTYNYEVETSEQLLSNQTGNVTLEWSTAGTYEVRIRGQFPRIYFNNGGDREKLLEVKNWGDIEWSSMERAFWGCNNFQLTATDVPDLSGVFSMRNMFNSASSFNQDISNWDVSSATDIRQMFNSASSFNQDLSDWDVSGVTNMSSMFNSASSFNGDISSWDVGSVSIMTSMFNSASSFNQDLSDWDVSGVTDMRFMFNSASSFNQDLSDWCVEQIASEPSGFANNTPAWVLPKPNWGDPC